MKLNLSSSNGVDLLVERSPESFDFAVCLRSVGPGPLVLDVRTEGLCEYL